MNLSKANNHNWLKCLKLQQNSLFMKNLSICWKDNGKMLGLPRKKQKLAMRLTNSSKILHKLRKNYRMTLLKWTIYYLPPLLNFYKWLSCSGNQQYCKKYMNLLTIGQDLNQKLFITFGLWTFHKFLKYIQVGSPPIRI